MQLKGRCCPRGKYLLVKKLHRICIPYVSEEPKVAFWCLLQLFAGYLYAESEAVQDLVAEDVNERTKVYRKRQPIDSIFSRRQSVIRPPPTWNIKQWCDARVEQTNSQLQ